MYVQNVCVYMYLRFYFKELAHVIMEAGNSKICRVGQRQELHEELILQFKPEGHLLTIPWEPSLLFH